MQVQVCFGDVGGPARHCRVGCMYIAYLLAYGITVCTCVYVLYVVYDSMFWPHGAVVLKLPHLRMAQAPRPHGFSC